MADTLSSGISTQDAMKSVITGSTSRTVGSTDLVQLYDNNGNPNGKIAGSALMSAVKTALGTLLNEGGAAQNTIDKVPSLNSGVLGAITTANLASVLGVMPINIWNPTGGVDGIKETCLARMGGQTIKTDAYTYSNQYGVAFTQILGASDNEYACQYFLAMGAQPMLFYRQTSGTLSSFTWPETWSIVYSSSLLGDSHQMSSLASALGVGKCQYIRNTSLYKLTNGIEAYRGVTIKVDYTRNDSGNYKWGEEITVGKTSSVFVSTKGIYAGSNPEYTNVKLYKNSTDVFVKVQSTSSGGSLTINSPLLIEESSVDVSTLTEVDWGKDVYCNYTSLSSLASALGGAGVFGEVARIGQNEGDDVGNLSKNGLYRVFNTKAISNIPTGISQNVGDIIFAFVWDPNTIHYLYLAIQGNKIFKGRKSNNSVTWNEI